jgi:hypothetical protein
MLFPAGLSRFRTWLWLALAFAGTSASLSWGQALPTASSRFNSGVYASFGGMKTHVEDFTFNALGFDAGLYVQPFSFWGGEVRGGSYPMYARFSQSPLTGGIHLGLLRSRPGWPQISGYVGGGMSKAQDAGPHYVATPAKWSPCWQASQEVDIPLGHLKWKLYEATFTQTYTPLRTLESLSVTTGFVYTIR